MQKVEMISHSEKETKKLAEQIALFLKAGDVITLAGDLGAGKTTFTKGIAKGLGIKRAVTSPTFTIVKQYEGMLPLYHIDAYRLADSDEDIGFDEYFYGDGVTVVEWATFIEAYLPKEYLEITIEYVDQQTRRVSLQSNSAHFIEIMNQLDNVHTTRNI